MIPIPPSLMALAGKQAFKLGSKLLIAVGVLLLLWYMQHSIYQSGYEAGSNAVNNEWLADKAKTDEEARQVLEKHRLAYEAELAQQKRNLIGAFNESEKLRNDLERNLAESSKHRMYVGTKKPASCGDSRKTETTGASGTDRASEEIYRAELDRETEQNIRRDYGEVAEGANACKVLLDLVESNFEVIK